MAHPTMTYGLVAVLAMALLVGCAAPAPTATPTSPPIAAPTPAQAGPTPTKAPTATPTKRPVVKASIAVATESFSFAVVWVTRGTGFALEEGLDMDWIVAGGGTKALAAVAGRSVDLGGNAIGEVFRAVVQGQPIRTIGALNVRGAQEIVIRKDIADRMGLTRKSPLAEKAKALKGLTISTTSRGGSGEQVLRLLLQNYGGLDPDRDVDIVVSTQAAQVAALQVGQVHGIAGAPPFTTQAVQEGFGFMLLSVPDGELPEKLEGAATSITVREDVMQSRPDVLEAFLRAIWRAERLIQQDRDAAFKALMSIELFRDADPKLTRLSFDGSFGTFPKDPLITQGMFDEALTFINKVEGEAIDVKYDQVVDNRFIEAAKRQLGF